MKTKEMPYIYFVSAALRPARKSRRIDSLTLRIDLNGDFMWDSISITCTHDFLIEMETPAGPISKTPLRASNLGMGENPFRLGMTVQLPKGYEMSMRAQNCLTDSRKWNFIDIMLGGTKVWALR